MIGADRIGDIVSYETLHPQAVHKTAYPPNALRNRLDQWKFALAETIAPIIHPRPGEVEFTSMYAPRPITLHGLLSRRGLGMADRKANQLLVSLPGEFGEDFYQSLELVDHHGKSHIKRVKAGILRIDEHVPELHLPQWVKDAQARFAAEHDANQVYQEYRILKDEMPPTIDSKYGHGLGGGVMSLALYKEYAASLHISEDTAKKISFATALMEIAHDNPNQIKQAIGLDTSVAQISSQQARAEGGIEGLRKAFDDATLDLFTLSPRDMLELLQEVKQRKGFDTPYGLGPLFEEQYQEVLEELSNDTKPLLQHLSVKEKQAIGHATLIAVVADMMDMILPNDEAFARMFTVPRAISNPLAWKIPRKKEDLIPKTADSMQEFADFFAPFGQAFWDDAQHVSIEELIILKQTLSGNAVSNAERKLLEAYEIGNIIQSTPLADNPTIQAMMQHYQAMTLIDIRHQVAFFMKGDREAITQHVHEIFSRRLGAVQEKLGKNHPDIPTWEVKLSEEADFVMDCLGAKATGIHVYDPEEIASFEKISRLIERAFWTQQAQKVKARKRRGFDMEYYISSHMDAFEKRYLAGERPIPPTKRYDSTGSIRHCKTIFSIV